MIIGLLVLPTRIYALTGSITISCTPSQVKAGGTVTCSVTGTSDEAITSIELPYTLSSGATITSYNFDKTVWNDSFTDNNKIEAVAENDLTGNFNIGSFTIKVNDNAQLGEIKFDFNNGIFYDSKDAPNNISSASGSFTVIEDVLKGLKTLTCTNCKAQPQLVDNKYDYLIELSTADITEFTLNAIANNANDTIAYSDADTNEALIASNITFKTSGGNTGMRVKITVGTGDNQTIYYVAVTKPVKVVGELSSLNVGGINVILSSDRTEYIITLDDVTNYQIKANVKETDKFTIEDAANILNKNLNGENTYSIYVKPINNSSGYTSTMYKITVKKSGSSSSSSSNPAVPATNPKTGETGAVVMGVILIISFAASIYFYKKNMKDYNN